MRISRTLGEDIMAEDTMGASRTLASPGNGDLKDVGVTRGNTRKVWLWQSAPVYLVLVNIEHQPEPLSTF